MGRGRRAEGANASARVREEDNDVDDDEWTGGGDHAAEPDDVENEE